MAEALFTIFLCVGTLLLFCGSFVATRRALARLERYCARVKAAAYHANAIALLKRWLSAEQLRDFETTGGFEVVGSETGTRYWITSDLSFNIWNPHGRRYCFGPTGVPLGDVLLAQKIALENFETDALAIAN